MRWTVQRLIILLAICLAVWAVFVAGGLLVGSTGIRWPGPAERPYRLEAVLLSSLVGAALAAAGVAYQAILRNPLAEPYLLGVSSGAALAAYLWALPFALPGVLLQLFSQQAFAFLGGVLALALVFALAQRRGRLEPVTLLLVGVILNAICGAVYLLVFHLNLRHDQSSSTGGPFRFLIGGIQTQLLREQVLVAAGVVAVGWTALLALGGQLNVVTLSESEAQSLGVRIHRLRWFALIVASLITAAAVSISGPIGFVGLVCPHLARLVVGADHRRLLPVATMLGASLLLVADAASRAMSEITSGPLPVGVLTGLLGGPFFLFLLWQKRREAMA